MTQHKFEILVHFLINDCNNKGSKDSNIIAKVYNGI